MRDRPEGFDEQVLVHVLAAWGIDAVSLTYAPVGFGDYHWHAHGADGRRWFVTVARNDTGDLLAALDTAVALRDQGLDFVVAPIGTTVAERYAISIFPFVDGVPGEWGEVLTDRDRGLMLDVLAALHRTAAPYGTPVRSPELARRPQLEAAIAESGQAWEGGPYSEPARKLAAEGAGVLRRRLAQFDRLVERLGAAARVVTHGEPHPGNVLRAGERRLLVDWDTVGLAVPERDLWLVAEGPEDLARYADAAGRVPDPVGLRLYRLRWYLDDLAIYFEDFRGPHGDTLDAQQAWEALTGTMSVITAAADGLGDVESAG